jgi:class 3 adenylate cyclase
VHRLLTFCLTDIEESTRLWDAVPEAASAILERHEELIAEAVGHYGGRLITGRGEGDSTFSVFDQPTDAVLAAAAIVRAMATEPWPATEVVRTRIAVHTGDVEVRHGNYYGAAISRTARLRGLASGGRILISGTTADLLANKLPPDVSLAPLGTHELRGFKKPETVVELVLARPGTAARAAPLEPTWRRLVAVP